VSARLEGALYRRSPAGATALTMVGMVLLGWGVVNSPLFGVERIRVKGVHSLSEDEVRSLAGVEPGANLLRLSMDRIAEAVERSPWVGHATVRRSLPTTLVISVSEREPVGWLGSVGAGVLVARDGTVLEELAAAPPEVPWLGDGSDLPPPGNRVPLLSPPTRVVASMGAGLLRRFSSVRTGEGGVELDLRAGGVVLYGAPTAFGEKNRALAGMLAWVEERGIGVASVDVRVPAAPALNPSGRT
jgi:cell division protein FtsQ